MGQKGTDRLSFPKTFTHHFTAKYARYQSDTAVRVTRIFSLALDAALTTQYTSNMLFTFQSTKPFPLWFFMYTITQEIQGFEWRVPLRERVAEIVVVMKLPVLTDL